MKRCCALADWQSGTAAALQENVRTSGGGKYGLIAQSSFVRCFPPELNSALRVV